MGTVASHAGDHIDAPTMVIPGNRFELTDELEILPTYGGRFMPGCLRYCSGYYRVPR